MHEEEKPPEAPAPGDDAEQAPQEDDDALVREELEEALREKEQFRTMAQRSQADLANYKRRASEEMEELRRSAISRLLLKIISVVDDLDRALSLVPEDSVAPGWFEGLQLVGRNMNNVLESEGVSKIEALGQPFSPWELEAVQFEETTDAEEGNVTRVLREGYKHHDRVLRAAQVIVAKKPEPEVKPESNEQEGQ